MKRVASGRESSAASDARISRKASVSAPYLGLDPRVRQSGAGPATHGRLSSRARSARGTRSWRRAGPPSASPARSPVRSAHQGPPRRLDRDRRLSPQARLAGAPRWQGGRHIWSTNDAVRHAERELALQAHAPTSAPSRTGNKRARARHRAAHLEAPQESTSRGRLKGPSLRFDSSSPAPNLTLARHAAASNALDLHPSSNATAATRPHSRGSAPFLRAFRSASTSPMRAPLRRSRVGAQASGRVHRAPPNEEAPGTSSEARLPTVTGR
jgi:hypothetical protein